MGILISFFLCLISGYLIRIGLRQSHDRYIERQTKPKYNRKEAEDFVKHLWELGYFKYVESRDLNSLIENMIKEYDPQSELSGMWMDDGIITPKDYRYYFCDGETLYEQGGFIEMLKELTPAFNKIGLVINVTAHFEVWDTTNNWLNHTININNTKYTIFKNFPEAGWGEAAQRLAEILNAELEKQGKDERVYLVSGANDGRIIFLTEPQFDFIDKVYTNKKWKPLKIKDWCLEMGVNYMTTD